MTVESRNFGFLETHDPLLVACAARAELYASDDPNTALVKLRQFGEYLARHVAAQHGLDTRGMEFGDVLRMLSEKRLIPRNIRELFDMVRLRGNEAIHEHRGDRQEALAGLLTAHHLSIWFHRTFVDPNYSPGPFRPLMKPRSDDTALRDELGSLRRDVARYEQELAVSSGKTAEIEELVQELEAEAEQFETKKVELERTLEETAAERDHFERELESVRQQARRKTPADLESFIERARRASPNNFRTGVSEEFTPIARVRYPLARTSKCHDAPLLLAQQMKGGFVRAYCARCSRDCTVKWEDFRQLDLWISCPNCPRQRLEPDLVRSGNYGFRCPECNWVCLLAHLLPNWDELF